MEEEIWRDIKGYDGYYQVSNLGRFKSLGRRIKNNKGFYFQEEKIMSKNKTISFHKNGIMEVSSQKTLIYATFSDNIDLIPKNLFKKNDINSFKVRCLTTDKEFDSINKANIYYDIKAGAVARCCKGIRKSAGKSPNGEKLIWEYVA